MSKKTVQKEEAKDPAVAMDPAESPARLAFPVVGIGASAGGLKALEQFFDHIPAASGMAFVIVQHLDPRRESYLAPLLQSHTAMPIRVIEENMAAAPDTVFVKPPDRSLLLRAGRFQLRPAVTVGGARLDIDGFFQSLAADQGENAIAVVLSGAASDGAQGARAIHAADGLVLAQDPEQAEYASMPRSAIETGTVDLVLPVEKMGEALAGYLAHARFARRELRRQGMEKRFDGALRRVLATVHEVTGHDFSRYKKGTVRRRIERRLAIHQLDRLDDYARYLHEHPQEAEALFKDMLINVTNFFRDPPAFEALAEALPGLLAEREAGRTVRVWVAGCATGEEAYTVAILLLEAMEKLETTFPIKIFATDINPQSVEFGREGRYPESIAADLSERRLSRFFIRHGSHYRANAQLRDMMVFAIHDLTRDPPFSRLDLVSCRNLLIYMDNALQKKVLPLLHYGLKQGGLLLLGASEEVGSFTEEHFAPVNRRWKLFQARALSPALHLPIPDLALRPRRGDRERAARPPEDRPKAPAAPLTENRRRSRETVLRELVETTMMEEYAPPGIVVDEQDRILYFHGDTSRFLSPPKGDPTFEVLKMVRAPLAEVLADLLHQVRQEKRRLLRKGILFSHNGLPVTIDLVAKPLVEAGAGALLVTFEETDGAPAVVDESPADARLAALERQLYAARQDLQATVEELEVANEELQSANEELQANNEELQSSNEELETSREELQSTNEELETVNAELKRKNDDLIQTNDDINNLFGATDIGTVILDTDLRIRRFTPAATRFFRLIPSDLDRPLTDIATTLDYQGMADDVQEVLRTLGGIDREIRSRAGQWYAVHLLPYRTRGNVIAGVILTFMDISGLKKAEIEAQEARELAESILATLREPLLVLDGELRVISANAAFYQAFQVSPKVTEGVLVFQLGNNQWDIPELRRLLQEVIPKQKILKDFPVSHRFPSLGPRSMLLNARRIDRGDGEGKPKLILLAFADSTGEGGER